MKAASLLACALLALVTRDPHELGLQETAALRAEGPQALARLLSRLDALPQGSEKDALERTIDAVAAQRYASVSRLYWYTDLDRAQVAARASGRPILSLRLLGRLDEDLSCANSRLFRVVLYADPGVSRVLRDEFVLHWSTERPVPRVTIDFGDGRKIETTIAGNSAHYVLDADGRPIDVLPGLYSPAAFVRELEAVLPLARSSPTLLDPERVERVRAHHLERAAATTELWAQSGAPTIVYLDARPGIVEAEALTVAKSFSQSSAVLSAGLGGVRLEALTRPSLSRMLAVRRLDDTRLSEASRRLVRRLEPIDWAYEPAPLSGEDLERSLKGLEALVAADTEQNELRRRSVIHGWFASFPAIPTLESLNDLVFGELFLTPKDDPWLGFSTRGVITGLPRDGVTE